jgi:NAD(P)-dependent dehydrogenase (short-subunit alcohol dehydrogenase family)
MMSVANFDLSDRIVVVTGGLGQLGKAFTEALRAAGARVVVIDQLAPVAPHESDGVLTLRADITSRTQLQGALEFVMDRWGTPVGLINNAGLDSPPGSSASENGPFEDYPEASWDRVFEVNAKGTMFCCQIFGGAMAAASGGSIANVGSIYGLVSPDQSLYAYRSARGEAFYKPVAYSASKSALLNLTRYLATYWGPNKVRVNMLTFGGVFNNQDKEFLKGYRRRVPLGRMASPDDYIGAVVYLMSDASAYMTGANLVIDGGWTAW